MIHVSHLVLGTLILVNEGTTMNRKNNYLTQHSNTDRHIKYTFKQRGRSNYKTGIVANQHNQIITIGNAINFAEFLVVFIKLNVINVPCHT